MVIIKIGPSMLIRNQTLAKLFSNICITMCLINCIHSSAHISIPILILIIFYINCATHLYICANFICSILLLLV